MKLYLLTTIAILFFSCTSSKKNDLVNRSLLGDISNMTEYRYEASEKFGEVKKGKLISFNTDKFNADGNIFESVYTSMPMMMDDTVVSKKETFVNTSKFNSKGQRTALMDQDKKPSLTFVYDDDNHIIEINNYSDGKLTTKTKYMFVDGKLTEGKVYGASGGLETINKYTLNDKKNVTEVRGYNSDNKLKEKVALTYNDNDLVTAYKVYSGTNVVTDYVMKYIKFDEKGNWIVQHKYSKNAIENVIERKIEYK
jgi:hypothetical protein